MRRRSGAKGFKSPKGRRFTVGVRVENGGHEYWPILMNGKAVGKLWPTDAYGPDKPWMVTTRELAWSGKLPPIGIGFDGSPQSTRAAALADFGKIADEVIDWREKQR